MKNYRGENRVSSGENGHATILGHPDVTLPCQVRDFSKSGLCITVDRSICSGTIVKVDWANNFLVGRAHTVSAVGSNFRVGLELLYCSKWNESVTPILARAGEGAQARLAR
jgi:hypothetical protein